MGDGEQTGKRGRLLVSRAPSPSAVPHAPHRLPDAAAASPHDRERPRALAHRLGAALALQPQLLVGAVDDPHEREAERTADAVLAGGAAALEVRPPATFLTPPARRLTGEGPRTHQDSADAGSDDEPGRLQRLSTGAAGPETVPQGMASRIQALTAGGGRPLDIATRSFFEPRFGYDFGTVRTHTGGEAAGAAHALGARAFTVGDHIFFGAGEYRPGGQEGRRLIAHELAHTVQQKPVAARVQRDWLSDPKAAVLRTLDGWAAKLPPYELLTVLLGRNPLTDAAVERNSRNFLRAALKLHPDGMAIFEDLEKNKTIEKVSHWFDGEVAQLNLTWEGIKALFRQAWDALGVTDLLNPSAAWEKIRAVFAPTLRRLADFAGTVAGKIIDSVKKALLGKLSAWAKEQRGYALLTFVLGRDPVTGEAVERTAKKFIKTVLELVDGGDRIYENLEKSKTIEKTFLWLNAEIAKLDLSWEKIKELFGKAWDAFTVIDLLRPLTLIEKIAGIFLPPAKRVISFAVAVGKKVLEFIFEGAMMLAGPIGEQIVRIVRKVGDTFNKIVEDPVRFVGHLMQAIKTGFGQFGKNIWQHLKTGLIEWLVGGLEGAGLVLPKVWDLKGIVSVVLQVLGISYAKMRGKLVKVVGEERVAMFERGFEFVRILATEGPAAAWQHIVEAIGSLWDLVIGGIKDWAVTKIVTAALLKLVTMLNPVGAVIQAIIATYNTIAFFVERIKQILALVEAITDSIASIAAGKLAQAADFVERAMARTIPVILGFLARLIGLGDVSGAVKKVITGVQARVDKAIDKVIAWIVTKAKSLFGAKKDTPPEKQNDQEKDAKWQAGVAGVEADVAAMTRAGVDGAMMERSVPEWKRKYGFKSLSVEDVAGGWEIKGGMSPGGPVATVHTEFWFLPTVVSGKAKAVEAAPLWEQSSDLEPSGSPVGWNLLKHNKWYRGHILHGKSGGPNTINNLAPIPRRINIDMYMHHERTMRQLLSNHPKPLIWFRGEVGYWSSPGPENLPNPDHFARSITIEYGAAVQKGKKAVRDTSKSPLFQFTYLVPLPSKASGEDFQEK